MASGSGSIITDPPGGTFSNTTTVTLKAIPAPGWSFLFWLGDSSSSDPNISLSMEYDRSVVAIFGQNTPSTTARPGLSWGTNLAAKVFAVDAQTNLYASAGGTVFVLTGAGQILQTNPVCPLAGIALRDSGGNFYFGGSFDGTQNFGGITLVGGWTNNNGHYSAGWPTCFLAKYGSNGSLQWVTNFGYQAQRNTLTGLAFDPAGGFYAGYASSSAGAIVAHLGDQGRFEWAWAQSLPFPPLVYSVRLGGITASNCCAETFRQGNLQFADMNRIDRTGVGIAMGQYPLVWKSFDSTNGVPVIDNSGYPLQVGRCFTPSDQSCPAQWLRKGDVQTDLWEKEITSDAEWLLARDLIGTLYITGTNGMLARYSNSGDLIWSNNFVSAATAMVIDPSGNRFVSFGDGTVARLGDDNFSAPSFAAGASATGSLQLSLVSQPQQVWQIQASSNLTTWVVLGTVTNGSGGLRFSDPTIGQSRAKFYKALPLF